MDRFGRSVVVLLVVGMLLLSGCSKARSEKLTPKVSPPAVKTAGILAVGVDLETPPFAGVDGQRKAGLDIDAGAALAERLGLKVRYVDVKPSEAATALADGTADVVMSVPLSGTSLATVALAGTYASDGPAFFIATDSTASVDPTMTLDTLTAPVVGAQEGSASYWALRSELGSEAVGPYESLRAAIQALDKGDVNVVAGDALVGAYIARDFPSVHFAGQLAPASPLAVAVSAENTTLEEAVRTALDGLAADGIFDTLRKKWVGDVPVLDTGASAEETATP